MVVLAAAVLAGCTTPDPRGPLDVTPRAATPPATQASPAPTAPAPTAAAPSPSRNPSPSPTKKQLRYAFPVAGEASFGSSHAGYRATDVFADCGTPVVAVTDGEVLEVSRVDRYDPDGVQGPDNGGLSVSVRGDDGVRYYGSHLSALAAGIDRGVRVRAGQRLGAVGRTGNANNICHLHFGLSPPCAGTGDWWMRRGVVWPAPYLRAWRRGEARSPAAEVAAVRCTTRPS
jgi:murein DD-endopeptidase MepM/ murein hydrolase activator NlpD